MKTRWMALMALATWTVGCADKLPPDRRPELPVQPPAEAKMTFAKAKASLDRHDAEGWTEDTCESTAAQFGQVKRSLLDSDRVAAVSAAYDQGLALGRCKLHKAAIAAFDDALAIQSNHARARTQRALHRLATGATTVDGAIDEVARAVQDSRYHDGEALVNLARLQMRRGDDQADDDGADDFARARKNLQRALALDDRDVAAANQLAILHLELARRGAGRAVAAPLLVAGEKVPAADGAGLELAALICAQALKKDPRFAPLHNTAGLVDVELGRLSEAARAFGDARRLDPKLFEAHMNYAAVNLQFRGFEAAEEGYRAAIALRPKDYDAQLGLALALRGQVATSKTPTEDLAEVQAAIRRAKAIDPDRPEAYFNEAILVEEFFAKQADPKETVRRLTEARALLRTFIERAAERPTMATAVERAESRIRDIEQMFEFLEQS